MKKRSPKAAPFYTLHPRCHNVAIGLSILTALVVRHIQQVLVCGHALSVILGTLSK